MNLSNLIKQKITSSIPDAKIEIIDFSSEHEDHHAPGAHIALTVISKEFKDKSLADQHKMIYKILEEELQKEVIHALRIRTRTSKK